MKKTNNYKIAVLSDLKAGGNNALKNAVGFAQMIEGEIELFHVKSSTDVVKTDNQFSALRSMKDEFAAADKQIKKLIDPVASRYGIGVTHQLGFGNVKKEITDYLNKHKPDIIVLGRRKSNPLDFIGDGITKHVLNHFDGIVMIASLEHTLEPKSELSMGILNGAKPPSTIGFFTSLLSFSKTPVKSFNFVEGTNVVTPVDNSGDGSVVQYVFEKGENTTRNLSNYISKNNINLLWIESLVEGDRHQEQIVPMELKNVIGYVDIPLLLTRGRKYS